jgi:hypothetical protein
MAQAIEHLLCTLKTLISNPSPTKGGGGDREEDKDEDENEEIMKNS